LNSELDHDVNEFWSLLFTIVLDGEKRLTAYLSRHGLTPPQFYVLKTLVEQGGRCPIGEIARLHHLTNATMTGLVKRLEQMSPPLVAREPNAADRRSVYVTMTDAGQALFLAVQADVLEQIRTVFSLLTGDERQELMHFFARYVAIISEQFPISEPVD
jgi:DNA-binding MarR family transcriptional regulator